MGCVLSQPNQQHDSSHQYTINTKQTSTKTGLVKTKTQTRSSTVQLPAPAPAPTAVTRQSSPAPLQLHSQPSTTSPTPSIQRITPTPSASKHEIAYEFTVEQPETLISTQANYPRIDLTLVPSDHPLCPNHLILPSITPSITPISDIHITSSTSPTSQMLGMESRRPNLIISTSTSTSTSTREAPTLTRPLSITTTTLHETTLKLPAINTSSSSSSTSTSPSLSIATGTSTSASASPSLSITTGTTTTSTFSPPTITTDSPRRIGPLTLQPLSTSTSTSSLSSSRPSLSRPGSADRSARHHHLPPPTPSHFTPHITVPDTPSFCSPRNAHAKSFFGASASKPPGFSRPSSASSRTTISQRITVTESESSSESEEVEEESSDDEEEFEEEVLDENAPPPVKSSISSSPASQISLDTTDDHDDDPPVFKSVAHLRIDPAAEPCATVIKPPLRRMCRARHVVWDASPEAAHAAYQPPSEILPFLYLGCYDNVYDTPVKSEAKLREMQSLGLSHILTVATECATPYQQFQYLKIAIQDDVRSHIHPHFTEAFDFIDQARDRGGKCIVHCWAGVSRSATIVIGYLIARCGMRFDVAHAHVRERRPIVHPNISFREALLNLDACVHEPERYKASQQEVIAMVGDSEAATMGMDREVMCGDRKLWGIPIHTLKR